MWIQDSWHLSTLNTDVPEELKHRIIAIPTLLTWCSAANGVYAPKVAYSWLTSHSRTVHSEHKWRWLWRLRVPEKIRYLFWLVFHGSLYKRKRNSACSIYSCKQFLFSFQEIHSLLLLQIFLSAYFTFLTLEFYSMRGLSWGEKN